MSKKYDILPNRPRVYSTREIMEITEERRRKKEAELKEEAEARAQALADENKAMEQPVSEDQKLVEVVPSSENPKIAEEIKIFVSQVNARPVPPFIEEPEEDSQAAKTQDEEVHPSVLLPSNQERDFIEEIKIFIPEDNEINEPSPEIIQEPQEDNAEALKVESVTPESVLPSLENPQIPEENHAIFRPAKMDPDFVILDEPEELEEQQEPEDAIEVSEKPAILTIKKAEPAAVKNEENMRANITKGFAALVLLSMVFFLISTFMFTPSWMVMLAGTLNNWVIGGSFFILNNIQGSCSMQGAVLNTHYYRVSLQGDMVALYTLELLLFSAVLFVFIQKTIWIKRGIILICMLPLAVIANLIRVLWACGLALNYGPAFASPYFHGALVYFVFIFSFLGLIFLEFLMSTE